MSVVMVRMIVPKHVPTLLEASLVIVIVVIYWILMGLLVMISTNMCPITVTRDSLWAKPESEITL